jgi:poly(3-hydroxybutyrate) depolymerase
MYLHVPPGLPAGRRLVIALQGCGQEAEANGRRPGWTRLADEYRFVRLLPPQRRANHPAHCIN